MYFAIFVTLNYRDDREFPEKILYATVYFSQGDITKKIRKKKKILRSIEKYS